MKKENVHVEEYITLEDVINSKDIMMVAGEAGTFFINLDSWDTPEEEKEWYKFTIDPFDIDFLKFRRMEEGFIKNGVRTFGKIYIVFKYLKVSNTKRSAVYSAAINSVFFSKNSIKTTLDKFNQNKDRPVSYSAFYNVRNKFKNKIKIWLERIFKEYNNFDNSLEYIKEYYDKWIVLVNGIQTFNTDKQNVLWRFINRYNIHNKDQFVVAWNLEDRINLKGLSDYDIKRINILLC